MSGNSSTNSLSEFSTVAREALQGKAFVIALVILVAAAFGLNASVRYLQLSFKKQPVPIGRPFKEAVPTQLGTWVQVARDDVLKDDFLEELGTREYLFGKYVNTAIVNKTAEELHKAFAGLSYMERLTKLAEIERSHPHGVLSLGLTYYTGKADTVAHVPERCYLGAGYEAAGKPADMAWQIGGRELQVRYARYESRRPNGSDVCNVAYFFYVNNQRSPDSIFVRGVLQDLRQRYGYYAKVELMSRSPDPDKAQESMKGFFEQALPGIEQALPDWSKYQSR